MKAKGSVNVPQRPPGPTALVSVVMKIKLLATGLGLCLLIPLIQGPENLFILCTFKIQSFFI